MPRRALLLLTMALVFGAALAAEAGRAGAPDASQVVVELARKHRASLQSAMPRQERDAREAAASLDRNSTLYARGLITREELNAAAREAGHARALIERTRGELVRADALIAELEARRRLARLPALRPGEYDAGADFVRFAGRRAFSLALVRPLEEHFIARAGRRLPVSAMGQSDVHTRLGFDHRNAVDLALHPDSDEGRLVMAWLREHGIPFMAFRGARSGAATGAHIHIGAPSERVLVSRPRTVAAPARHAPSHLAQGAAVAPPAPTTQVLTR